MTPLSDNPSLPIIDLKGLDGSFEERMETINAIRLACEEWGFFLIVNHGVKTSLMEEMLKITMEFFSLTSQEKMMYGEKLKDCNGQVIYHKGGEYDKELLRIMAHQPESYNHLWPDSNNANASKNREVVKEYHKELWKLVQRIVGAISEGLGLERDYIEKAYGQGSQISALHNYPPYPGSVVPVKPHRDSMALALLMQNDVDGLEMMHNDNWIKIHPMPGSFIVNVGDCIEILSNGKYKSILHQGVSDEKRNRFSIATGYGPDFTTIIEPAASLVGEKEDPKYKPIMFKDYMNATHARQVKQEHVKDLRRSMELS